MLHGFNRLKDAYYSVTIVPEQQKYLKFQWQGQLYKFTCFPNGLSSCPRKFTKLLKPVYSYVRELGHMSASHIDDTYLQGDDYADCEQNVLDTLKLFDSLGFTNHQDKSSLIPKQRITVLGCIIDSVEMRFYPTPEKIAKVEQICKQLLNCTSPSIREVASVLGLFISLFSAAQFGPLHFQDLDMDKSETLKTNKGNFDKKMLLSKAPCHDLNWWVDSADTLYKPISLKTPDATLYTDASKKGWGGVLEDASIGGQWTLSEQANHINYLEMLAVFLTLKAFRTHLANKHLLVRIDNMTAVADIAKMGTCHSRERNKLTQDIWDWCIKNNVFLTTSHMAGKDNTTADVESRKSRKEIEWALDQQVYMKGITKLHFAPGIDPFALRLNYKVKPFVAYQPDPEAMAINAFTVIWEKYSFYAFPPFSLTQQVLSKIQEEKSTGLLVVSKWPTQPWRPHLMRMLIPPPLLSPKSTKTLYLPTQPDLVHPLHQKLVLMMCHLSGDPSRIDVYRQTLYH